MNRVKWVTVWGSAGVAAALCVCAVVNAAESKTPQPSGFLIKDLKAAQDAMKAQDPDKEIAALQKAQGEKGSKTPYDEFLINAMLGAAYAGQKQYVQAAPSLQAAAESQYSNEAQKRAWLSAVLSIYSQLHQYPKAIEAAQTSIKLGVADSTTYVTLAVDQDAMGQHKEAANTLQQLIAKEPKPEEKYLIFQWNAYTKANDVADSSKVIDELVTYYPKPEYWLNALQPLLKMNISDAHLQLDVYRLMNDIGVLKNPRDVAEMAELSFDAGYPGETVAVLNKAFANNIFTDPRDVMRYQHLLTGAKQKAMDDQASLASQEQKAQSGSSADALVAVGAAYLSYGQADKAAQVIEQGIAKGGLQHEDQAELLLGIAQLQSHNAAAAHRTFDKVAGSSNEGYSQLGRLWMLHAQGSAKSAA